MTTSSPVVVFRPFHEAVVGCEAEFDGALTHVVRLLEWRKDRVRACAGQSCSHDFLAAALSTAHRGPPWSCFVDDFKPCLCVFRPFHEAVVGCEAEFDGALTHVVRLLEWRKDWVRACAGNHIYLMENFGHLQEVLIHLA